MTAWGVVAVCAAGGALAGPFLDAAARRVRRPVPADEATVRDARRDGMSPGGTVTAVAGSPCGSAASATGGMTAPRDVAVALAASPPQHPGGPPLGVPPAPAAASVAETVGSGALTALVCALAAVRLGARPELAAYCALFAGLVAVSITDLRTGLVPRRLLYPASVLVVAGLVAASSVDGHWRPMLDALIGGAAALLVFGVIWWIYPRGLGFGDVRLAALCGAALGWLGFRQLYLGFFAAFVVGTVVGLAVLALRRRRRFPFAPALAVGTAFGVLWGGWLGNLWLHPG